MVSTARFKPLARFGCGGRPDGPVSRQVERQSAPILGMGHA
jgi:hypothetical protein